MVLVLLVLLVLVEELALIMNEWRWRVWSGQCRRGGWLVLPPPAPDHALNLSSPLLLLLLLQDMGACVGAWSKRLGHCHHGHLELSCWHDPQPSRPRQHGSARVSCQCGRRLRDPLLSQREP